MKGNGFFLFFCMIFAVKTSSAQFDSSKFSTSKPFAVFTLQSTNSKISNNISHFTLPANFYECHTGFFCKQELSWQKATKIPLKIRLGSVQYTDWMEGKKGAGILKPGF